jgi:hypothetical protein
LYSKTKEHKEQVSKYNDEDLTKFNENELKWLFKLKWITKLDFQQFLAKIKAQIKNKKQNKDNKK